MRQEQNASGTTREQTELDQALEEIIDKEKLADEKISEAKKKKRKKKQLHRITGKALWDVQGRPKKEMQNVKPMKPRQKRVEEALLLW